MNFENPLLS